MTIGTDRVRAEFRPSNLSEVGIFEVMTAELIDK